HSWKSVYTRNQTAYWRRPEKDFGISATTNYGGCDLLKVFSTSTEFDTERSYSKFAAYTLLNFQGDFRASSRHLAEQSGRTHVSNDWRLLDDTELDTLPIPEFLVDGVLQRRSLAVIYGPSGTGKTTLVASLATALATGTDFCGRRVLRRGATIYVAAE